MKTLHRICVTLLVGCLLPLVVAAQHSVSLSFAPKIGVNFSEMIVSQPTVAATLSKMGWNLGLDARMGNRLTANGGLHYYRLGSAVQLDTEDSPASLISSQFKVPIGVGYKLLQIDYFKIWARFDAVLNYTLSMVEGDFNRRITDYPRTGFGSRMGVGMDLGRLTIEVHYERGHTKFLQDLVSAHNRLVIVSMGVQI